MDCQEARGLLSAYFDGELPSERRQLLESHLRECAACEQELAQFGAIPDLVHGLDAPLPPVGMWEQIESGLDDDMLVQPVVRPSVNTSVLSRFAAIAAAIVVVVGIGVLVNQVWYGSDEHGHLAADFAEYLEAFQKNPTDAHESLVSTYQGEAVSMAEATKKLGYRPAVANGLPERYSLDTVYVLKMPCCTCVQSICKADDGTTIALFEHETDQPIWFGNRPSIRASCFGKSCDIVQVDGLLAVSWQMNRRHLTVVGARDLAELEDLIRSLQDDLSSGTTQDVHNSGHASHSWQRRAQRVVALTASDGR